MILYCFVTGTSQMQAAAGEIFFPTDAMDDRSESGLKEIAF